MTALLVALGAGVGAPVRYLAGHFLDGAFHRGTFAVNVLGSFLLGLLSGLAVSGEALALLGVGFCGAVTTWSALAVGGVDLATGPDARPARAAAYVFGTVGCALVACGLGFVLAA